MADKLGTEETNTLTTAAAETAQSSTGLNAQVKSLISDLEEDASAVAGNTLPEFRKAQNELVVAFNELTRWMNEQGANLNLGQERLTAADADSEEGYREAKSELARSVNGAAK